MVVNKSRMFLLVLLAGVAVLPARNAIAQSSPVGAATPSAQATRGTTAVLARRRSRRRYRSTTATPPAVPATQQPVGPTPAQRRRDAQILAAQQKQSAEIARQQAIVTGNVIKERQAQQAEPRIQDAPGPGSEPLPGDPSVPPATTNDPSRIQDAPGPAQTLPQALPPATAPAPQQ